MFYGILAEVEVQDCNSHRCCILRGPENPLCKRVPCVLGKPPHLLPSTSQIPLWGGGGHVTSPGQWCASSSDLCHYGAEARKCPTGSSSPFSLAAGTLETLC